LLAQSGATQRGADDMLQLAHYFRINSKQQLAMACSTVQGTQSDASLAASIAIALMDVSKENSLFVDFVASPAPPCSSIASVYFILFIFHAPHTTRCSVSDPFPSLFNFFWPFFPTLFLLFFFCV
jgi:hypothetical protein